MKEEATKRSALYNSIFKLKKRLPLSVYDGRKPLYQAVSTSLPTGIRGRTAYLHCIKDGKNIDPACGSGAFPIGMLQLLIKTYDRLSATYDEKLGKMRSLKPNEHNNLYLTKLFIIRNSLYSVDIEPMAIEISRLRAWLSLIIDDKQNVDPLPNLDFNFVCANTLLPLPEKEESLFEDTSYEERFNTLRNEYFNTHDKKAKDLLRLDFEKLYSEKTDDELAQSDRFKKLTTWDPFRISKPADFFDPKTMFNTDGFSIVIGNPPYVQLQKDKEKSKNLYKPLNYETYEATGDLYCLFIEKGVSLLKEKDGVLAYITSNKWMRAGYGEKLRGFLAKNNPMYLIDFGGTKVFDSATVDTDIIVVSKEGNKLNTKACRITLDKDKGETLDNLSDYIKQNSVVNQFDNSNSWVLLSSIEKSIKEKIEKAGTPLKYWDIQIYRGVLTGYNEAFIISTETRNEILERCKDDTERKRTKEIIRPILRGKDIKCYGYKWADLWLINTHNGIRDKTERIHIKDYPAIKKHLDKYWDKIEARADQGDSPYNLRNCAYMDDFSKPKIIYSEIVQSPRFFLDKKGEFYPEATSFIMTGEHLEYLVRFFNSKVGFYLFKTFYAGGGLGDNGCRYKKQFLEKLPIPKPPKDSEEISDDDLIKLYGLTKQEAEFILSQ